MVAKKEKFWKQMLRNTISGILEALLVIVIFLYVLPILFNLLLQKYGGGTQVPIEMYSAKYYAILFTVLGLSVASKALKGTIFRPILSSAGNLLAFLYALSFIGTGVITVENIEVSGMLLSVSIDLGIIMIIMLAFFAVPAVVMPFITYFTDEIVKEK